MAKLGRCLPRGILSHPRPGQLLERCIQLASSRLGTQLHFFKSLDDVVLFNTTRVVDLSQYVVQSFHEVEPFTLALVPKWAASSTLTPVSGRVPSLSWYLRADTSSSFNVWFRSCLAVCGTGGDGESSGSEEGNEEVVEVVQQEETAEKKGKQEGGGSGETEARGMGETKWAMVRGGMDGLLKRAKKAKSSSGRSGASEQSGRGEMAVEADVGETEGPLGGRARTVAQEWLHANVLARMPSSLRTASP
eukprot:1343098-Pleurochrysis_carterae.AAC.1